MAEDWRGREGRYPASWQEARWAIATELQGFSDKLRELSVTVKDEAEMTMGIRDRLLVLETRFAVYAAVGGFVAGGVVSGVVEIFRKYL